MTQSKVLYSLPKTQPTLSSSSKSRIRTHKKLQFWHITPYPEVSVFNADQKDFKYTHNMHIDYGKLSQPFKPSSSQNINKEIDLSNELGIVMSTRKFKDLKQYALVETEREGIQPPIHALLTQKKAFSTERLAKAANPESSNKISAQRLKKKNRIISVKAYQNSNNLMHDNKKSKQFDKIFDNVSQVSEKGQEQDDTKTDRSDRKISHSRIIKTFNPTAGIQTKIITYPDLSEVFKIRQSRKKVAF